MNRTSKYPKPDSQKWVVFFIVAIGVYMSTLDSSIVNIALPSILEDLKEPLETIEWIVVIYLLTLSSLLLPFGRLGDIKGRRWVFGYGLLVFSIGSLLCGVAINSLFLIASRIFQAVGAAMIMSCSQPLIVDTFPVKERGKIIGMVGTIVALGLTSGPAIGGFLIKAFSWRAIFYINVPIGIVSTVIGLKVLRGTPADIVKPEPFDWTGSFLLIICFSSFIFTLTQLSKWSRLYPVILILSFLFILSSIIFIQFEKKARFPIFEPGLLKIKLFILPVITALILFAGLFVMVFLMPFYLTYLKGFSYEKTGLIMVIPFIFLFFLGPLSGSLSDRIGSRVLCTLGMLLLSISLFSLSGLSSESSILSITWRLALSGIGISIFLSPNISTIITAVSPNRRGIAGGTIATARSLGMVIGVALSGLIFNYMFYKNSGGLSLNLYNPQLESVFIKAFKSALISGIFLTVPGIILSFIRGKEKKGE